jgi:enoyl-CoA hydratase/carnithine racemase
VPQFEKILYEKRDRIAIITINRPESMNAIDPQTSEELHDAWCDFRDDRELWVAILTGAGDRAFSAGNDLVATARGAGLPITRRVPFGGNTRDFVTWKPTIAAINGYCIAGGVMMAIQCDIRIAAEHARFGVAETRWNMGGAYWMTALTRIIGLGHALELCLWGDTQITAQRAYEIGLVNQVVPKEQLMDTAMEWARRMLDLAPRAVRNIKETLYRTYSMGLHEAWALGQAIEQNLRGMKDSIEGPRAFVERRRPVFLDE